MIKYNILDKDQMLGTPEKGVVDMSTIGNQFNETAIKAAKKVAEQMVAEGRSGTAEVPLGEKSAFYVSFNPEQLIAPLTIQLNGGQEVFVGYLLK